MIGAIIGDIAGSRFEIRNHRSKDFVIFHHDSHPTDDSVMSLAVAKAILDCKGNYDSLSQHAVAWMQKLGRMYKNAGYGGAFIDWIWSEHPRPYKSFGNGAAMRVGPCGFAAENVEQAKELSKVVTEVTHNHPEGLKGAEAVAVTVFLARSGKSKTEIKDYVKKNYYNFNQTIDELRPKYQFDVSCQGSVPVALEAFFEAENFEDAIRNAVSVGGDSDTIAAITGVIAEAYYGVPAGFIENATEYLYAPEMEILYEFERLFPSKAIAETGSAVSVFDVIDNCVDKVIPDGTQLYEGDEPPEPNGFIGLTVSGESLLKADGTKPVKPVHVWVRKEELVPDFSSFTGKHK